jgi:hypothetical protein
MDAIPLAQMANAKVQSSNEFQRLKFKRQEITSLTFGF